MRGTISALASARSRAQHPLIALLLAIGLVVSASSALAAPADARTTPPTKGGAGDGDVPTSPPARPLGPAEALLALAATLDTAPAAPSSPDDRFVAILTADHLVIERTQARVDAVGASERAAQDLVTATVARDDAAGRVGAAAARRDRAKGVVRMQRKRLSDLTVTAYVRGGDDSLERVQAIAQGDTSDAAGGRQVVFGQVLARQRDVTTEAVDALTGAEAKVLVARQAQDEAQAALDRLVSIAAGRSEALATAERAERDAVEGAAKARRSLQAAAAAKVRTQVPLEVALVGPARLQPEDLAGWFATTAYAPRIPTPIGDFARWFIEEGNAEGIRGDIAFAQAVLETGGFANQDSVGANNYAGIGHCDSCGSGFTFPGPQAGVRAQIQLLKSYAVARPRYVSPLVDARLRGPAGCCPTWGDLTRKWATDPGYGPKVMAIYTSMVDFAMKRRAGGPGLEGSP